MKSPVSQVHVIFKTHLDLGFTDFAKNVVRRYMAEYIPAALRLARQTRGIDERFVWTLGSWLVYRFLEEAPRRNREAMEEAIIQGDIHWHALPFTTHTELLDPELFRQGLRYCQILDRRFGRTTRAAKMTDVPGHTRGIVPLLAEGGVRLLHIGVNPASTVPKVPPVFLWRAEGEEIVVIYENVYGATTLLPGGVALSVNLTGDNLGPQNPQEVKETYDALRRRFPKAGRTAGNLNVVADWMWKRRGSLPVVTSEIGDTWIHGVGTDPAKVARYRCLCRFRSRWIGSHALEAGGKDDFTFAENLLLTAEHTWGMDIKTHLRDRRNYSPARLRRSLPKANFQAVIASWKEQRRYVTNALRALPAGLAKEARRELACLRNSASSRGWKRISAKEPFQLGGWHIALGPDGSIQRLQQDEESGSFADTRHRLGSFAYQLFSPEDYRRFYRQYNQLDVAWARDDFTKPGLPPVGARGWHTPRIVRVDTRFGNEARIQLRFPIQATRYGAPAESTLYFQGHSTGIDLRLEWKGKPANRIPEAFWLTFQPRLPKGVAWTFEKLGFPIDPRDVVGNGNKHLHAVSGPVSAGEFSLLSLDAPLIAPGRPSLLDFNNRQPNLAGGVSVNLYNNVWGTNFPMWNSDDAVFRFQLRIIKG